MRTLLLLAVTVAVAAYQPISICAQGNGAPTFDVELVDFPSVVEHGQSLEGHVRVANRGDRRGEFRIHTNVDTPYGPATLFDRSDVTVEAGETVSVPWLVRTGALEPGSYEVIITVKRGKTILIAPLRFSVV